jgi:hypothetical protein
MLHVIIVYEISSSLMAMLDITIDSMAPPLRSACDDDRNWRDSNGNTCTWGVTKADWTDPNTNKRADQACCDWGGGTCYEYSGQNCDPDTIDSNSINSLATTWNSSPLTFGSLPAPFSVSSAVISGSCSKTTLSSCSLCHHPDGAQRPAYSKNLVCIKRDES